MTISPPRKRTAALLLGLGLAAVPLTSHAGYSANAEFCATYSDGSGSCSGNFRGFAASSDPSDYAWFTIDGNGSTTSYGFRAYYNDGTSHRYYTCVPSSELKSLWPIAMANPGYFYVTWDSTGTCTRLALYNASQYSDH